MDDGTLDVVGVAGLGGRPAMQTFVEQGGAKGLTHVDAVDGQARERFAVAAQPHLPIVTIVIGDVLLVLRVRLVTGHELGIGFLGRRGIATRAGRGSQIGCGATCALASLSCTIGPLLAVIAGRCAPAAPARWSSRCSPPRPQPPRRGRSRRACAVGPHAQGTRTSPSPDARARTCSAVGGASLAGGVGVVGPER